jgi:flavin-dependent dehydrogenase
VLIVGGGPAGLAAAIALRMKGADVLVADALKPPIDKACGEGLMPDTLRGLRALGVACGPEDGARFRGIRFENWTDTSPVSVSADFTASEGIGMRRTVLHTRLVDRAMELGVRLRWKTHVTLGGSVMLDQEAITYRYLIGADGQSSKVRRWAGLDQSKLISRRFGFRRHYRIPPVSDYVEVHWGALGQVYITPVAQNEICVAVVTRHSSTRMQHVISAIPSLREWLQNVAHFTGERGALTTTRRLKHVVKDNIALIGDASGSVDAVTGEGLALGFRQADLLSRSLEKDTLADYAVSHQSTLRMPQRMSRILLAMDAYPSLRNAAMQTLAGSPELFRRLLRVHLGEDPLGRFLLRNSGEIAMRMAFAGISASE